MRAAGFKQLSEESAEIQNHVGDRKCSVWIGAISLEFHLFFSLKQVHMQKNEIQISHIQYKYVFTNIYI